MVEHLQFLDTCSWRILLSLISTLWRLLSQAPFPMNKWSSASQCCLEGHFGIQLSERWLVRDIPIHMGMKSCCSNLMCISPVPDASRNTGRDRKVCLSGAYLLLCFWKSWMFCSLVSFTWENLQILPGVSAHFTVAALTFVWRSTAVIVLYNLHNFLILILWLGQVFKHMLTYGCFVSPQ